MSRINVLDSSVFNKIAAGEVVEKPASIIKEFVENSLDAGATEIFIEIENGGIDKIKVVDNGHGIHPDDVKSAFLPHATSKIKTVEDLTNIITLGFRGEALASISSVSKTMLSTKQKEFDTGKKIVLEGGIIKEFTDIVLNNGTIVEVSDLFYNIPARKKFLRKPKTEESEITNLVMRYILANPTIKFNYIVDGKQIYKTSGTNIEDAVYLIYKQNVDETLIKVDYEAENVKIEGYISKPNFTKNNRTYQTLIINGRYVVNNLISTCVQNAYQNYLMKGQFPFYILNLTLPADSLDVNVHPNKLDVKFENSQRIYGYFYSAVSKALLNFGEVKNVDDFFVQTQTKTIEKPSFTGKSFVDIVEEKTSFISNKVEEEKGEKHSERFESQNKVENIFNINENVQKIYESYEKLASTSESFYDSPVLSKVLENTIKNQEEKIEEVNITYKAEEKTFEEKFLPKTTTQSEIFEKIERVDYKIIGTCMQTYILLEMKNSLFVLDQHACHERLNYDKLINQLNNKNVTVQDLLIPYVLETNPLETDFLLNNLDNLNDLGFSISLFGEDCFRISSVPSVLYNINLNDFFKDILSDLNTFKKITTKDLLNEKLSQKACKSSVRAGDKLSEADIDLLLGKMAKENMTLACPHGRPCVIEITKDFIEKSFKRKV